VFNFLPLAILCFGSLITLICYRARPSDTDLEQEGGRQRGKFTKMKSVLVQGIKIIFSLSALVLSAFFTWFLYYEERTKQLIFVAHFAINTVYWMFAIAIMI
jgi:predicted MFS family arabinose efflux permease